MVSSIGVQSKADQWVDDWIRDGQSRRDKPHPHLMERIDVLIGKEYLGLDSDRKGDPLLPQVRSIVIRGRMIQERNLVSFLFYQCIRDIPFWPFFEEVVV